MEGNHFTTEVGYFCTIVPKPKDKIYKTSINQKSKNLNPQLTESLGKGGKPPRKSNLGQPVGSEGEVYLLCKLKELSLTPATLSGRRSCLLKVIL